MDDTNNILSLLEGFTLDNPDDIAMDLATDFRNRRIERGLTREQVAEESHVALANIARFEQKGLISLHNLICLAMALDYKCEVRHIFSQQKFTTMAELEQIKQNMGKKRARRK